MIQVIAGKKGSGKTKRIIDMANLATRDSKHDIVFIDDDARAASRGSLCKCQRVQT